ncbi:MAG: DNA mismatch repair protein MutL [Bacteroidetes bacterium]|nr:MAG: DNA mismatch repair protein MutL [Bacteroidota bacterium]
MPDIIRLLPDTVANQIAAGEVVQRPASVVKELLENAVDAGATEIRLIIKDSGKTLIQVSDNGKGMSETDARMSFERHATSKISNADDLFAIRTKGFRGEALASIAAVAQVELRSRREEDELGTQIIIEGGEVKSQEPCQCAQGSVFFIKNLFYNIPARRKFLKTDGVELRHIIEEFERVALAHPEVGFILTHNGTEVFHLERANASSEQAGLRQRITSVFGNPYNQRLAPLEEHTDAVIISGFIGKPEFAKKTRGEQFFFLNKRFIKNSYLHHAVVSAFEQLLPTDAHPTYFIFLEMAPSSFDVNIHPTKTEVKFEDERLVYAILRSVIKKSLGQYNIAPTLDFEQEMSLKDIPLQPENGQVKQPGIHVNPDYNPFAGDQQKSAGSNGNQHWQRMQNHAGSDWQKMFETHVSATPGTQTESETETQGQILHSSWDEDEKQNTGGGCQQLHGRYVLSHIKSGLMIIDQQRAHERILYERYLKALQNHTGHCQQKLFPETVELAPIDSALALELTESINALGFDIRPFGQHTFVVHGVPAGTEDRDVKKLLEGLIGGYKENLQDMKLDTGDNLARSLAKQTSIRPGKTLSDSEMRALVDELFACELPYAAPDGKPTVITYSIEDLDRRFKR